MIKKILCCNFIIHFLVISVESSSVKMKTPGHSVRCMENGRFYRDPDRLFVDDNIFWSPHECSKYYLCLENEVFEFKCSSGLVFDVARQICDMELNVDNCDLNTTDESPSDGEATNNEPNNCANNRSELLMECSDGSCVPQSYFCDGSDDCPDGSDEINCGPDHDYHLIRASPCNTTSCNLPECFCSKDGTEIPAGLEPSKTPQMILLTFDDAVNYNNWDFYKELFGGNFNNPNGCPIKATFFVSHHSNNYHQTQKLWNDGHEIAVHSITHRSPVNWWANNATVEDWFDEMVGQANILHKFSSIRMSEIRGLRVPFLKVGWNRQFLMMKEFGFVYDSSLIAPFSNPPLWPYSLDFEIPHDCSGNCPTRAYPGLWEMVMNQLEVGEYTCAMVGSCPSKQSKEEDVDQVLNMFMHNFKRHYLTNRAPYGLYFHANWFQKSQNFAALKRFIAQVLQRTDVWFVTNSQALNWIQNPAPNDKMDSFGAWNCNNARFNQREIACNVPNICKVSSSVFKQERYLYTCVECPKKYPWIRNEFGID